MRYVVVDTNVLISGTFWRGASSFIIDLIEQQTVLLVLSKAIMAEYDRICTRKRFVKKCITIMNGDR